MRREATGKILPSKYICEFKIYVNLAKNVSTLTKSLSHLLQISINISTHERQKRTKTRQYGRRLTQEMLNYHTTN